MSAPDVNRLGLSAADCYDAFFLVTDVDESINTFYIFKIDSEQAYSIVTIMYKINNTSHIVRLILFRRPTPDPRSGD